MSPDLVTGCDPYLALVRGRLAMFFTDECGVEDIIPFFSGSSEGEPRFDRLGDANPLPGKYRMEGS